MYKDYFGLNDAPFSIAPDPRYLFLSDQHQEALAHLLYGVGDQGGFVLLTGEVGTGKTTISRCLLQQMPADSEVAYVVNPRQTDVELLRSICDEFGIYYFYEGQGSAYLVDLINEYLLNQHSQGKNCILIVDEAQNLKVEVLEQLRLLTNLETDQKKLLQLILLGQPELNELLARPELRQMAQRITARYHLSELGLEETEQYIRHRLSVAGCRGPLFSAEVIRLIYKKSAGIPRLINVICDRCLLGVYSSNMLSVDLSIAEKAILEVQGIEAGGRNLAKKMPALFFWLRGVAAAIALVMVGSILNATLFSGDEAVANNEALVSSEELVSTEAINTVEAQSERREEREQLLHELVLRGGYKGSLDGVQSSCAALQGQSLVCLKGRGDVSHIAAMSVPVLMLIQQTNRPSRFGLVDILDSETAMIQYANGEKNQQSLVDLAKSLPADFEWVWSKPEFYRDAISLGEDDAYVHWLSAQLVLDDVLAQTKGVENVNLTAYLLNEGRMQSNALVSTQMLRKITELKIDLAIHEPGIPAALIQVLQARSDAVKALAAEETQSFDFDIAGAG